MTHTPGPWSFKVVVRPDGYCVESDGSFVCEAMYIQDAWLISAAPEMLDALKEADLMFARKNHSTAECDWMGDDEYSAWTAITKAIKKAEGRS